MRMRLFASALPFALLLASCGGGSTESTTTTEATSTSTSTSIVETKACTTDDLDITVVSADAGAGQRYLTYGLRNKTSEGCTTTGFPGMAFYSGDTVVVSNVERAPNQDVADVTIEPDLRAFFDVAYSVNDTNAANDCTPITKIEITPPNQTTQLSLPVGETDLLRLCPSSGVKVTAVRSAQTVS